MSGETEADISAWTIDSLRYHLEQIAADLDKRYEQRFEAQEKAVDIQLAARDKEVSAALAAHDKTVLLIREGIAGSIHEQTDACLSRLAALEKAYDTRFANQERAVDSAKADMDNRFGGVNEFRGQLRDQQATFLTRDEYNAAHIALIDKVDSGFARFGERLNVMENRLNLMTGQQAGSQEAKTSQRLDNGQLIAVVSTLIAAIAIAVTLILALNG